MSDKDSAKTFLIDTHTHIYYNDFEANFDAMLLRSKDSGVGAMIVVGTDLKSSRQAIELAEKYPNLYAAAGIHPHDAGSVVETDYEEIQKLVLSSPKVVAIGEIGLDYYRDRTPREAQQQVFSRFLDMAAELHKPVIIHDRDSHEDVMNLLIQSPVRSGVLHCFSGDSEMASKVIKIGFYISIPGTITYPSNDGLRNVVRDIPIEHLLLETDCPYLSPVPHRGKRNEPAFVKFTAEKVAELKGMTLDDVARITTKNAGDLFGIPLWDQSVKIAYRIRNSLYLNITNVCSNHCIFCPKFDDFVVKGHNLSLKREPTFEEVLDAIGEPVGIDEIVFCGYGEPLSRLELVKELSTALKKRGYRIRVNTDGQANMLYGRNILPELVGLIDIFSISLNAPDSATYIGLCNTPFGKEGFKSVCDFIRSAAELFPGTIASAVTIPGVDIEACKRLAESLGAQFRAREYEDVG